MIDYIRSSFETLTNIKAEEDQKTASVSKSEDRENVYEAELRKLEEEIRNHIGMEHQLKLQIETMVFQKDEMEHLKIDMEKRQENHREVLHQ